jgi:hypothetical protein
VVVIIFSLGKNTENLPFIEVFFMSETQSPEILKQFFEHSETELWLSLAHFQISLIHETIKVTISENPTVKTTNMTRRKYYPAHGEAITN